MCITRSISGRRRNYDLLGSTLEMGSSFFGRSKDASGFNDVVGPGI